MKTQYIKAPAVKKLAKEYGKRTGTDFIEQLDRMIFSKVIQACNTRNGTKKTLDRVVAIFVGIK